MMFGPSTRDVSTTQAVTTASTADLPGEQRVLAAGAIDLVAEFTCEDGRRGPERAPGVEVVDVVEAERGSGGGDRDRDAPEHGVQETKLTRCDQHEVRNHCHRERRHDEDWPQQQ